MNKKILIYVLTIVAVTTATYTATSALLSDTSEQQGNTFSVGTLQLDVAANSGAIEPIQIENLGTLENSSGSRTWTIQNSGNLKGKLGFGLENVLNNENGCNEPEAKVDATCDDPGIGMGELGNTVYLTITYNNQEIITHPLNQDSITQIDTAWNALENTELLGGEQGELTIAWTTNHDEYGNEVQSDSLTFDVWFDLQQVLE